MDRQTPSSDADAARIADFLRACRLREESVRHPSNSIHQAWHDLKESLHVAQIASALLKTKATDDDGRNIAEFLLTATSDMQQHLADLPDYARLEAGRETRTISTFDAGALFREVADGVRRLAEAKGFTLTANSVPLSVRGDFTKVQRIAGNLLRYCVKHARPGEIVLAWKSAPPGKWTFRITAPAKAATEDALPNRIGLDVARGFCKVLDGTLNIDCSGGVVALQVELPIDYPLT